jgi:hypothetical protein
MYVLIDDFSIIFDAIESKVSVKSILIERGIILSDSSDNVINNRRSSSKNVISNVTNVTNLN